MMSKMSMEGPTHAQLSPFSLFKRKTKKTVANHDPSLASLSHFMPNIQIPTRVHILIQDQCLKGSFHLERAAELTSELLFMST